MTPKTNLEAYNCVVGYNAQVDRRIVEYGMVQDTYGPTENGIQRQQQVTTAFYVVYISPKEP